MSLDSLGWLSQQQEKLEVSGLPLDALMPIRLTDDRFLRGVRADIVSWAQVLVGDVFDGHIGDSLRGLKDLDFEHREWVGARTRPFQGGLDVFVQDKSDTLAALLEENGGKGWLYKLLAEYPVLRFRNHPLTAEDSQRLGLLGAWDYSLDGSSVETNLAPHQDKDPEDQSTVSRLGAALVLHQPQQDLRRQSMTGVVSKELYLDTMRLMVEEYREAVTEAAKQVPELGAALRMIGYSRRRFNGTWLEYLLAMLEKDHPTGEEMHRITLFLASHPLLQKFWSRFFDKLIEIPKGSESEAFLQDWALDGMENCTLIVSHRLFHFRKKGGVESGALWRGYI